MTPQQRYAALVVRANNRLNQLVNKMIDLEIEPESEAEILELQEYKNYISVVRKSDILLKLINRLPLPTTPPRRTP